jgi:hypothetical protein
MMSLGVRAAWTKTMSGISPESQAQVVIDIRGVTPDPAEMNRYFGASCRTKLKIPAGP